VLPALSDSDTANQQGLTMGSFCTISACIEIDALVSEPDAAVLHRMLNHSAETPRVALKPPEHSFFHGRPAIGSLKEMLQGLTWAAGSSSAFQPPDASAKSTGFATLFFPYVRDPLQWEVYELIDWVARLSAADGFLGTSVDAQNHKSVKLFYAKGRALYFGDSGQTDLRAFSSDQCMRIG
jgi:hypothetical protein